MEDTRVNPVPQSRRDARLRLHWKATIITLPETLRSQAQHAQETATIYYGVMKSVMDCSAQQSLEKADLVNKLRLQQGLHGVVIRYNVDDSADEVNALLKALRRQHISAILMGDPDVEVINFLHLGLVDGLIIQNASVLPNGQRRDFFRAAQMRECVARCKRQMKGRPDFFMGFFESWTTRPSAATLRRAFKLADFFGAVIQAQAEMQHHTRQEMCLSGFDWLKRPEMIYLQKCWTQNPATHNLSCAVTVNNKLDIQALSEVLGPVENLLTLVPLPPDLLCVKNEPKEVARSPDYVTNGPRRASVWDKASCGATLCEMGCYRLREQITQKQYDCILQTQRRLKQLQMLHVYADIEIMSISKVLNVALKHSRHQDLFQTMLDQLTKGHMHIYKGLDSGFNLPDHGGHLLGLSDSYEEDGNSVLDIYVSSKAAYDVATIWHVFLAQNGVPRSECYEEELLFHPGEKLPKSLQQELNQCTEAELLSTIQQIRMSTSKHAFDQAIIETCTFLLLKDSSKNTWTALHSRACLDRSLSIREILQLRLEQFAKQGIDQLPELAKLVELSELLTRKLQDALFASDRVTLSQLSTPLIDAYNTVGTI
jgi:hypothetical protein